MGLFDKNHYHNHGTQYHSHTSTVTEKRAPTDDSVRLLKEMEDKALSLVANRLKQEDNVFGDVLVMRDTFDMGLLVAFKLNGKQYKFNIGEKEAMMAKASPHSYMRVLYDSMAKVIAEELLLKHVAKKL